MVNCQMGKAIYDDIAFTIPTRIDASGAYYVIEEITTEMNEDIKTEVVGYLDDGKWANMHEQSRRVYGTEGVAPTIHTCGGGNLEPKIIEREVLGWTRDANGNVIDRHPVDVANCVTSGKRENTQNYVLEVGVSVNPFSHKLEYKGESSISEDVAPCLRATDYKCPHVVHEKDGRRYRIRKLTERECFRLMGCDDADIDKIQSAGISKTQQYKMAGNSIVVDVLYHIFRKMFVETKADAGTQLELF